MNSQQVLENIFGYSSFRTGQEEIIESILNGKNVLAVLPTGAGKSLCYQIPALLSKKFSVVISPLIALMKDQVDSLNKKEKVAAFINSSLDFQETETVLNDISNGKINLLYLSPEKISNKNFADRIKALEPEYIFIDEAHCISEWGHNFRPSYRKIKDFIQFCGVKKISAFTATATEEVRKDIIQQLELADPIIYVKGFERDNLTLKVIQTKQKKEKIAELLKQNAGTAIVYSATRKGTEEVTEFLRANKIDSAYFHAGLTSVMKQMIQDDFISGRINTIVATNAFGMGIDKNNIRTVIHYNIPGSIENYYQEIGRAGRDGKDSKIFLLYDARDRMIQEYFISASNPSREQIENVYDAICNCGNISLGSINERNIPVDSNMILLLESKRMNRGLIDASLKVLEESGYIKNISELENKHFVQLLLRPDKLHAYVKNFTSDEHKDLILLLMRLHGSKIINSKTAIDVRKIGQMLDLSEKNVSRILSQLNQAGVLSYEQPFSSPTVRLSQTRVKAADLKLNVERMNQIRANSQFKMDKMIDYVFTEECRFKFILDYFGQRSETYRCKKCDRCLGETSINRTSISYLEEIILHALHENHAPIKKKNVFQILSGSSKDTSLKKFSSFGACKHFKKNELETAMEYLIREGFVLSTNDFISLSEQGIENFVEVEKETPSAIAPNYEEELKMFNLLRQIRKEAADKFNQHVNLICPDEILRAIAKEKPVTHSALLSIKGFNQRMFNKVGDEFLSVLKSHSRSSGIDKLLKEKNIPQNVTQIYELIQKRYSLEDIVKLTKLSETIVSVQIETLLEMIPKLEIDALIDKKELMLINSKIEQGITEIKLLREVLGNKIGYSKLRIALAKKRVISERRYFSNPPKEH